MSAALASIPDIARPAEAEAPGGGERPLAILGQLAEIGLTLAQGIERQAAEGEIPATSAAIAYGRVARAVRLTIALQSKLVAEAQAAASAPDRDRDERRTRIRRIVGRVVDSETLDRAESVYQKGEAAERLEHDDIYGDLLSRPTSEIVAEVCRDLGLKPHWSRLATEAWARDEIAAGAAGAPLTGAPLTGDLNDDDDDLDDLEDFEDPDDFDEDVESGDSPRAASP